jgi:hypothetical protein
MVYHVNLLYDKVHHQNLNLFKIVCFLLQENIRIIYQQYQFLCQLSFPSVKMFQFALLIILRLYDYELRVKSFFYQNYFTKKWNNKNI